MITRLISGLKRFGNRTYNGNTTSFNIPVLCYHSWTIDGESYGSNDHVCLEQDLRALADRNYKILPVPRLIDLLDGSIPAHAIAGEKLVCITFDDGRDFDYHHYESNNWGVVKSFYSLIKESEDFIDQFGDGPRATSFVIASPEARSILDITCGDSNREWQDDWWRECAEEGVLGIANHSWDHVHDTLPQVRQRENKKGSFYEIKTFEDAQAQLEEAQCYIDQVTGNQSLPVFAYPYGHVSSYLRDEYLPSHGHRLGLRGAFSTAGRSVQPGDNLWDIPRFVCGDWRTPDEFGELLQAVERGER